MAGFDLPIWIIRRQIASAVQIIVQVARLTGGVRKVIKISEITGMEGDVISMHDLFVFKQTGVDENRVAQGYFFATGIRPQCLERLEISGDRLPDRACSRRRILNAVNRGLEMTSPCQSNSPAATLLTFIAVVTAVAGVYSIVSDLYLRDRSRVSSGSTTSSASGSETEPKKSLMFKDLRQLAADGGRRAGSEPSLRQRFEAMVEQSGLDLTAQTAAD